jgi:hypothetical protein
VSAPPTYGHRKCLDDLAYRSFPETPRHYQTMESVIGKRESLTQVTNEVKLPKLSVVQSASTHREDGIQDHGDEHDTKMSSRELLSEWCCSVSMVWVQIPSREVQNLTALKSNSNTVWFNFQTYIYKYIYIGYRFYLLLGFYDLILELFLHPEQFQNQIVKSK